MSFNLVTSEKYIDNIKNSLTENQNAKSSVSNKSERIFNKVINSPNFIFNKEGNSKEDKEILKHIKKLVGTRPGRHLFKRLLKTDNPLKIIFNSEKHPCYSDKEKTITLNSAKVYYTLCVDKEGKKVLRPQPKVIIFAHELVHCLHYLEERKSETTQGLLDPDLDNLEEQEAIIGKVGEEELLCENVFRFHFGWPMRIDHQTLRLNERGDLTATECAAVGALASLKERLLFDRSLLNLPQPIRYDFWWKQRGGIDPEITKPPEVTPLNVSISKNRTEIFAYLLACGADIEARDTHWGTALHTAVKENRSDMMKKLIDRGADTTAKDPKGLTPLRLALNSKDPKTEENTIVFLASLSDLKEIDENRRSILHHAIDIHYLKGFKELIRCGADINCKDLQGDTPLIYSIRRTNCVDKFDALLEEEGLEINAENVKGKTALSMAVEMDKSYMVRDLVNRGALIPVDMEERVMQIMQQELV